MSMYQEQLMDHFKHPRNRGILEKPDIIVDKFNPACGDSVLFYIQLEGNVIKNIAFEGKGCVISQAAASMLSETIKGMPINNIIMMNNHAILDLIGMQLGPTRQKCALLSLHALQEGLRQYQKK